MNLPIQYSSLFSTNNKFTLNLSFLYYLFVNTIFVYKYSLRQNFIDPYLSIILYIAITLFFLYSYSKVNSNTIYNKFIFIGAIVVFFLFTIYLNLTVDGDKLRVDRWSAMHVAIEALLNGQYPYSAIDHLNGRTSNLPTLILLGIPFYLMGNIGLIQSFGFLLMSYIILIVYKNYKTRLFVLFLLIASPSYIWEIYVKSDLMTNSILVMLFMIIVQQESTKEKSISPAVLSFFATALTLTRLTVVLPMTLLLFKKFWYYSILQKIIFIVVGLLTGSVLLYICFMNVSNWQHFIEHNPFELQNRQLPTIVSIFIALATLGLSFKTNNLKAILIFTIYILIFPIALAFILNIYKNGVYNSIINSAFDISYFNIAMPFVIIYLGLYSSSQKGIKNKFSDSYQ